MHLYSNFSSVSAITSSFFYVRLFSCFFLLKEKMKSITKFIWIGIWEFRGTLGNFGSFAPVPLDPMVLWNLWFFSGPPEETRSIKRWVTQCFQIFTSVNFFYVFAWHQISIAFWKTEDVCLSTQRSALSFRQIVMPKTITFHIKFSLLSVKVKDFPRNLTWRYFNEEFVRCFWINSQSEKALITRIKELG